MRQLNDQVVAREPHILHEDQVLSYGLLPLVDESLCDVTLQHILYIGVTQETDGRGRVLGRPLCELLGSLTAIIFAHSCLHSMTVQYCPETVRLIQVHTSGQ